MYQETSEQFNALITTPGRTFRARLLVGDKIVEGINTIELSAGSNNEDGLTLGSTISKTANVTMDNPDISLVNKEFSLQIGLKLGEGFEYIPMGVFMPEKIPYKAEKISFTAYDRMMYLECSYASDLPETTDTISVLKEIERKTGVEIIKDGLDPLNMKKPENYTYREVLGYIAGLYGKFAIINRSGDIELHFWQACGIRINGNQGITGLSTEAPFDLEKIEVTVDEEQSLTVGSGVNRIAASNPYMTQSMLNKIWSWMEGYSYHPASCEVKLGDPRLDPWDIVELEDRKGNVYTVPLMSMEYRYDGGLSMEIASTVDQETNKNGYKGPLELMKERMNRKVKEANISASEAKEAADGALQSARDALQESKDANTKAEDAVNAANQATQSAQDAKERSEEASTAIEGVKEEVAGITQTVNAADTAAKEAKKAAEAAEGKAVEAKESAEAAKLEAEKATLAAGEAGEKAADAQEKAESAMGTATTAQEKADAASETAGAAKLDAEAAQKDIDTLGENLTTLENTMRVEYARKTDLTETEASLETKIQQNAAEISSTAKKVQTIDETANNAASLAEAAQKDAQTAKEQADQATLDAATAQEKADAAKLAADSAQTDANMAKAAADAAQGVADTAEANLAKAQAELASVKDKVDATEQDILAAQEKVTAAQEAADKAKEDAETAISKANTAQSAAETATSNAATAQTKADDAADKANKAQTKAEIAQEAAQEAHDLAEQAQADIEKAQSTANQAKADAKTAQETADLAKTNAATAQTKADAAAKSAADAQGIADLAKTNAEKAQADLDTAKANLAEVTGRVDATAEEVKTAQADVIKAQTAADKAKTDAAEAQKTADTAKTNAATAQTKADQAKTAADTAQSAADKAQSAADKAQADVDALEIRTKTAETKIEQNAEKIALAATKEEVRQTLGGYYTKEQADAAITVKADEISNKVSKTYATKEALDGLTIGGRNLLRKTNQGSTNWDFVLQNGKRTVESFITEDGTNAVKMVCTTPSTGYAMILYKLEESIPKKLQPQTAYTLSFDLLTNMNTSNCQALICKTSWGDHLTDVVHFTVQNKDETWNRIKIILNTNDLSADKESQYIYIAGFNLEGYLVIKNLKLEKGNKATDWTPAPEDVEEKINDTSNELHKYVTEQSTSITNDCEKIILDALTKYVETGDLESYKSTVETQLTILSNQMELKITESRQQIESVNSELQSRLNTITKYFTFDINGMTIGQVESPNKVVVDNDEISILVGDNVVQKFDALGRALIPEVSITRRMTLFGYAFTQDENGNVNVDYVGGEQ